VITRGFVEDVTETIYREAHYLDERRWDDWLALFADDAVFWMPAWRDEEHLTDSPDHELSLIYCRGRAELEDRVWRLQSGLSGASTPLARTAHAISNALVEGDAGSGRLDVRSSWTVQVYNPKTRREHAFFGRYEHTLRRVADRWVIARKKIVLINDRIPTMLDFYCV
jgi:3-phenylpropionate/cinnamic acid dioxygenase small subunit